MTKNEIGKLENTKIFWSPSVRWKKNGEDIQIEVFLYKDVAREVFPEFYYLTQEGILVDNLLKCFSDVNKVKLKNFIKDLMRKKVLVTGLLSPQEIFYPQKRLFDNKNEEDLIFDPEALKKYKTIQLNRRFENCTGKNLKLNNDVEYPDFIKERRSYRKFDEDEKISFNTFSKLLSIFKQYRKDNSNILYYYASAGGLYPIDVFVYVKKDRVEDINAGLYYYDPIENQLCQVSDKEIITEDAHLFINKDIFKSSAFSIYLIYNANANIPKYGGNGYLYALLDAGIMIGAFTQVAELNNIGLCSIGDMNFSAIEDEFKLTPAHIHLHALEVGIKK